MNLKPFASHEWSGSPALALVPPPPEPSDADSTEDARSSPSVIRYERGSRVVATDGLVGTLKQIVIDEDRGEIKALVIRANATKEMVLVPPDLVDKSVGDTLLLQVTREQFQAGASRSPRFNRRMFTAADCRNVARSIPLVFQGDRRCSLVRLSQNSVETSDRLERSSPPKPAGSPRPRWRLFARDAHAARSAYSATGAD